MRIVRLVAVAAAGIALGVAALPPVLWHARLHPTQGPVNDDPGRHGLAFDPVAFGSPLDGVRLRGWYLPSPMPTGRAIVVVHGIDDDRRVSDITLDLAPTLLAAGFDVLTFDLRGAGESEAATQTFGVNERWDVLGAVDEARRHGARQIGVLGFSLGAGATLLAAAGSDDIAAVAVDSAFGDLERVLRHELETGYGLPSPLASYALLFYPPMSGTAWSEAIPADVIARIAPRPVLLIHGTGDRTVPVTESDALLAAADPATTQRWLVPDAGHIASYWQAPDEYRSRIVAFFAAAMPEP